MNIGVLGAGQLGRMLALAGIPLGMRFHFLDPTPGPPAASVGRHLQTDWNNWEVIGGLIRRCDVITWEIEHVPLDTVAWMAERTTVYPAPTSLRLTGDRLAEKQFLAGLGIEVAPFAPISSADDLGPALAHTGLPAILKTRRGGYDGRGQVDIGRSADADAAFSALGGAEAVVERRLAFTRELALVSVRSRQGDIRVYPLTETRHEHGILARAVAPAPHVSPALQRQAEAIAVRVLQALEHVGVLTIECFEVDGRLLVNELAPRVHNSGHWTIEGAETSQFENHLRAITGLPLGETTPRGVSGLINLVGHTLPPAAVLAAPGAHLHLYDKHPRPGRKLGHITVTAATHADLHTRMEAVAALQAATPLPALTA